MFPLLQFNQKPTGLQGMNKENYYIYHSSEACPTSAAQIKENLYLAKTVPRTFPIINLMFTTANDKLSQIK